ncbi:MAG: metal-binding protein [Clostridiales bacterium]|nr:metal-binding protein [Clostridiales bacterium]
MSEHFKFFTNKKCEYFPCHEVENADDFNCLFCFCPLYALGDKCGGNFTYLKNGVKDCSNCTVPHGRDSHTYITDRYQDIVELIKRK